MQIFVEIALLLSLATVLAVVMKALRQPLVVAYILTGIIAGPNFLNVLHARDQIDLFSKIGITILLFIVGLNMSPKVIKEVGKVSVIGGLGQIIFTALIGFSIAIFLGFGKMASTYIAISMTFSSTIIVLKLLTDRGDLSRLYGKITIGFMIVQDIIATFVLLFVSSFTKVSLSNIPELLGLLALKAVIILFLLFLTGNYVIPKISRYIATSQEVLFLFSMSWGLGLAALFAQLGFSMEIGALVAGVTLSLTPFAYEIAARLKPLRDFFVVLFFVLLGSQMVLNDVGKILVPSLILSVYVLLGKTIIVVILMSVLAYRKRTSLMTGLAIAQISEFSLILAALGYDLGQISRGVLSVITIVGLVTIAGSTYFLKYADWIYKRVEKLLSIFELEGARERRSAIEKYKLLLFGYDSIGQDFVDAFKKLGKEFLVVDFNPESVKMLAASGIPHKYGDAEDLEFLQELNMSQIELCVSIIPDLKTNIILTEFIKDVNPRSIVIVVSHDVKQAEELYESGATYVVMPHYLGARHAANMIARLETDLKDFEEEREKHLAYIQKRKMSG